MSLVLPTVFATNFQPVIKGAATESTRKAQQMEETAAMLCACVSELDCQICQVHKNCPTGSKQRPTKSSAMPLTEASGRCFRGRV